MRLFRSPVQRTFASIGLASLTSLLALISLAAHADALPSAPIDPQHPGSKIYSYGVTEKDFTCSGREVNVFLPTGGGTRAFPVVVYGHGQALGVENYRATLEHLAKKGVIAIFPTYDSGFFDQDWTRMGRDYSNLAGCAIGQLGAQVSTGNIVFSGHSKGAYVASIAAGLAEKESLPTRARSVVLFEAAGSDAATLSSYDSATALTVVFSDADTTVQRDFSETIYAQAASHRKQFIYFKSYPSLKADHMWPLTKGTLFGGGPESAFHYYGEWKWLVAAAQDLTSGASVSNPYIYGALAGDKGVSGLADDVRRSFQLDRFSDFDTESP